MAAISTWTNVKVFMESALGSAVTISSATNVASGVFTCSAAHSFADGDHVLITASGMTEVNNRVFKVKNTSTTTFQLYDTNGTTFKDLSGFGTLTAGTAKKITFGTTLATLATVNASGGEPDSIDTTTIHDKQKSTIPGMASPSEYSFDSFWDLSDAGLVAAEAASSISAQKAFQIKFTNGQYFVFTGRIFTTLQAKGSTGGRVDTTVKITAQGAQTNYAQ